MGLRGVQSAPKGASTSREKKRCSLSHMGVSHSTMLYVVRLPCHDCILLCNIAAIYQKLGLVEPCASCYCSSDAVKGDDRDMVRHLLLVGTFQGDRKSFIHSQIDV